jgi:HEPN domain-containing protein
MHILLNDFAIRSFRDTADQDYIAARLCYRNALIPQFHWASLQALEKYLKCILVLNRLKAQNTHNLGQLLQLIKTGGCIELGLTKQTQEFLVYLDTNGRHRYFESSWAVQGHELLLLDWAVWDVRRFARVLVPSEIANERERVDRLREELQRIQATQSDHPQRHSIPGGTLEQILADSKHRSRSALVWQNGCFGKSFRKKVKYWPGLLASNSPLTLRPEILDEALKYVWLSTDVKASYRAHQNKA